MQRVRDGDLPVGGVDAAAGKHEFAGHELAAVMAPPHQNFRLLAGMIEDDQRRGGTGPQIRVFLAAGVFLLDRFGVVRPLDNFGLSRSVTHIASASFDGTGVPPKPCMRKAHCQPISAPLTRGRSASDIATARISPATIGIHIGASGQRSSPMSSSMPTMWPTIRMVK